MYKNPGQKFTGACFLLVRKQQDTVVFLGTAFLVHESGYLLTAAHLIEGDHQHLMVARPNDPESFSPLSMEEVGASEVELVSVDTVHNSAVLKLKRSYVIATPDHLIGHADNLPLGTGLISFGFPFGHQDMHNLALRSSILSSKALLLNGTKLLLFDSMVHDGMAGGPLVSIDDERIVGIVIGRFSPEDDGGDFSRGKNHPEHDTSTSYAVSIEYGYQLLINLGLTIS
ncbi:MAG: serine protease [Spirochaetia bacterium]|nr:serine protease [Spirochaetia bacterium]MCF7940847.1 serine protease [Spirochaetia bacterium]